MPGGGDDPADLLGLTPEEMQKLRADLYGAITEEDWAQARAGFGDPDLATQ